MMKTNPNILPPIARVETYDEAGTLVGKWWTVETPTRSEGPFPTHEDAAFAQEFARSVQDFEALFGVPTKVMVPA